MTDLPVSPDRPDAPPRRVRSFVVRDGRIGSGQQRALRELAPRWVLPFQATPLDLAAVFGRDAPCVVEIGFGMGHATAELAAARPDLDILGIEVHPPGVGALLQAIESRALGSVRIVQHDAVDVLERMVAPGSLAGVHIWFPDPWPKKRHHKRRLIQPPFVDLVASRLAPGGWLHLATDWAPYAQQMRAVLEGCPRLRSAGTRDDGSVERPSTRPTTKFETRGLRLGHGVWDFIAHRVADADAGDEGQATHVTQPA